MQIDLPQELILRVQQRAALLPSGSESEVIRKALDSLDLFEEEKNAIQVGIDAWRSGDVQPLTEFDSEFRAKNRIHLDS